MGLPVAGRVALRKESVDRNIDQCSELSRNNGVALRKESVDRNVCSGWSISFECESLSVRRAWIEMLSLNTQQRHFPVALRKESVDRNVKTMSVRCSFIRSLSVRRAWIEMLLAM